MRSAAPRLAARSGGVLPPCAGGAASAASGQRRGEKVALYWGSRRYRRHAQHDMTAIIQSTGSCQVELVNPGAALILEGQCLHDQADSHKGKNGFFAAKFCQEPSRRLQTALLSENGRRIAIRIMPSIANGKAAIYLAQQGLVGQFLA